MNIKQAVLEMPWYDTHCHMGCLDAVGYHDGAFRCDCVRGLDLPPLDLWALLTSPYMKWTCWGIGVNLDEPARKKGFLNALEWARTDPREWWSSHWSLFERFESTGVAKCLIRGIRELHGVDLTFEADSPVVDVNERIRKAYEEHGFYGWWKRAFDKLGCAGAVKLVEMPYYDRPPKDESCWNREKEIVTTALRVDTFTTLHLPPERLGFRLRPKRIGIEASSLGEYLSQVDSALERASNGGMRGIKHAIAYFGSLKLEAPDTEAAERYVAERSPEDFRHFESAVLRRLLSWCDDRTLPYQMHAGVQKIPWCNPLNLIDQFERYPNVKFTLLHLYPYIREAGVMAKTFPNVYLDPCWLSVINPEILKSALREWIGMVPPEKILFGIDTTSPEEWYGAAILAKEVLGEVLEEKVGQGHLSEREALKVATKILHDNARAWYG